MTVMTSDLFSRPAAASADLRYRGQQGNRVNAIGDSTVIGSGNSAVYPDIDYGDGLRTPFSTNNVGSIQRGDTWLHHACLNSGGRYRYGINAGIAGNTSRDVVNRLDHEISRMKAGDVCVVLIGTNDVGVGAIPFPEQRDNLATIYRKLREARITPVGCLILPNSTSGRPAKISQLNSFIRDYTSTNNIDLIDFHSPLIDTSTGGLSSTYDSGDGTHPTPSGYQLMGTGAATVLRAITRQSYPVLAAHNADTNNLLTNGLFLTDGNSDGIADNWANFNTVGGTNTLSTADGALVGKAQRITLSGAATGQYGVAQTVFVSGGKIAIGDTLRFSGVLTNSGLTQAAFWITFTGSTVTTTKLVLGTSMTATHMYEECTFVVPPGSTNVQIAVLARSGTGYVEASQVKLENLSRLDLMATA